jgi:hypothetical protein
LDIGVGAGNHSTLFRPQYRRAEWVGVEIWGPYIKQFRLNRKYDKIIIADIRWLDFARLGNFDICFCGDIIEHMPVEDAQRVVGNLLNCCRLLLVSIPIGFYPQGPVFDNPFERHVINNYSDAAFRHLFPAVIDGIVETIETETIGAYALARDAKVLAAFGAHQHA